MLDDEDQSHSCVAELRTSLELLRSEMICKLEDQKSEYELRLDAQRSHMVQKEGEMRTETDDLRAQVCCWSTLLFLVSLKFKAFGNLGGRLH